MGQEVVQMVDSTIM